jgi:hypothetical protein
MLFTIASHAPVQASNLCFGSDPTFVSMYYTATSQAVLDAAQK